MTDLRLRRGRLVNEGHGNGQCYQYSESELQYINELVASGYSVDAAIRKMRDERFRFKQGRFIEEGGFFKSTHFTIEAEYEDGTRIVYRKHVNERDLREFVNRCAVEYPMCEIYSTKEGK